jgi:protein SCO1/2
VSYASLGLTLATGAGLMYWFQQQKDAKMAEAASKKAVVVGQAALGGPFSLVDAAGRRFTEADLRGAFSLLYFGFTHCPDICPEELEKVAEAVDLVEAAAGVALTPVFISVDPQRDTVAQVGQYVREFHPRMVGLTGTPEATAAAARAYRVYHTRAGSGEAGPAGGGGGKDDDDYLIDHSIITYLLDPDGKFLTFYGRNYTAQEMADSLQGHVAAWRKAHPEWQPAPKPQAPK